MTKAQFGAEPGKHIPGQIVHKYLAAYAKHFRLNEHLQCNSKVETAECKGSEGWLLSIVSTADGVNRQVLARKLIIATGLTSEPSVPKILGSKAFQGPIVHTKYLVQRDPELMAMSDIVVLGNSKSAYDAAYSYASRGKKVHLIIRESGKGPLWMVPSLVTPFKIWIERLLGMRLLTWFSPCVWGEADGYGFVRRFLNGTLLGRFILSSFWAILTADVEQALDFNKSAETKRLKPWTPPFWHGSGLSLLTYDNDFQSLVRTGRIEVHISDIEKLSADKVHLRNGVDLKADTIVSATGWSHSPPIKFLPSGIENDLGLPGCKSLSDSEVELSKLADVEILERYPFLKNQPTPSPRQISWKQNTSNDRPSHPWRLFRFIAPPAFISQRTIAFAGMLITVRTSTIAELQALWITSFLDGSLNVERCLDHFSCGTRRRFERDSLDSRIMWDTMLMTQFGRWRHPSGVGDRHPDFAFDSLPYFDLLMGDLGLEKRRKRGWFADIFQQHLPEDHGHVVEEWMKSRKKDS
ncbi:MAG: hypothetical protein Q9157_003233 [Trypethelium eluteriae]